jgi:hypothetical protein
MRYQCLFDIDKAFIIEEKDIGKEKLKKQFIQELVNPSTHMTHLMKPGLQSFTMANKIFKEKLH